MAKFSKAQYEIITEAIGEALADIRERDSKLMDNAVIQVARRIADAFQYDNSNFDRKQFMVGVESVAELSRLAKQGIDLG